jgi:hypothetical protein
LTIHCSCPEESCPEARGVQCAISHCSIALARPRASRAGFLMRRICWPARLPTPPDR